MERPIHVGTYQQFQSIFCFIKILNEHFSRTEKIILRRFVQILRAECWEQIFIIISHRLKLPNLFIRLLLFHIQGSLLWLRKRVFVWKETDFFRRKKMRQREKKIIIHVELRLWPEQAEPSLKGSNLWWAEVLKGKKSAWIKYIEFECHDLTLGWNR